MNFPYEIAVWWTNVVDPTIINYPAIPNTILCHGDESPPAYTILVGFPASPSWFFRGSGGGTPQQAAERPQGPAQRAAAAPLVAVRRGGQGVTGGSHGQEEEAAKDPTLGAGHVLLDHLG